MRGVHEDEIETQHDGDERGPGGDDAGEVVEVERPGDLDLGSRRDCGSVSLVQRIRAVVAEKRGTTEDAWRRKRDILLISSNVELHVRFMMAVWRRGRSVVVRMGALRGGQ